MAMELVVMVMMMVIGDFEVCGGGGDNDDR